MLWSTIELKMEPRKWTQRLIVITLSVWIVWDIIAALWGGTDATESGSVRDYTYLPAVPVFIGGLCGHFMFHEIRVAGAWGMWVAIGVLCLCTVWSALVKNDLSPLWLANLHSFVSRHPVVPFVLAVIMGGALWGLAPTEKTL